MSWEPLKPTQKQMQQLKKSASAVLERQGVEYDLWLYNLHLGLVLDNQSTLITETEDLVSNKIHPKERNEAQKQVSQEQEHKATNLDRKGDLN